MTTKTTSTFRLFHSLEPLHVYWSICYFRLAALWVIFLRSVKFLMVYPTLFSYMICFITFICLLVSFLKDASCMRVSSVPRNWRMPSCLIWLKALLWKQTLTGYYSWHLKKTSPCLRSMMHSCLFLITPDGHLRVVWNHNLMEFFKGWNEINSG